MRFEATGRCQKDNVRWFERIFRRQQDAAMIDPSREIRVRGTTNGKVPEINRSVLNTNETKIVRLQMRLYKEQCIQKQTNKQKKTKTKHVERLLGTYHSCISDSRGAA